MQLLMVPPSTRCWGKKLPQQLLLTILFCLLFSFAHAEDTITRDGPPPGMMPGGHTMPDGSSMSGAMPGMQHAAPGLAAGHVMPGGSPMPEPGHASSASNAPSPSHSAAPQNSFAPNKTGSGLPPAMSEELANQKFGVEGAMTRATSDTHVSGRLLEKPVTLSITFHGPLWSVRAEKRSSKVRGYGVIEVNEDTLHDAVITQSGVVRELYAFPGMLVKAGDPLISIFSPERVNAQHMFLADFSKDEGNQLSLQYYSSFSSTEKYLEQSRSNLKWWGFSDSDIATLLKTEVVKEDYVFQADENGYVLEAEKNPGAVVVSGEKSEENFVIPGETVMRMATLDTVWGMSFVRPEDDSLFKLGDAVQVKVGEGADTRQLQGLVVHKHETADTTTRKSDFHILLENSDLRLPLGSQISFTKDVPVDGLWVPREAVVYVNARPTAIRKAGAGFEAVNIVIGRTADDFVHVVQGLREGDRIVAAPRTELNPDARFSGLASWE